MTHELGFSQNYNAINSQKHSPNFGDNQSENPSESLTENLSQLKNNELHLELQNRVAEERKLTHQILLLIIEIDQRKLYLPMACSSLFDYLVKVIRYSPASAQRRIDAAGSRAWKEN